MKHLRGHSAGNELSGGRAAHNNLMPHKLLAKALTKNKL